MTKKKKFESLPDVQTKGEINGMELRNGLLIIWHEEGAEEIEIGTGKTRSLISTAVNAFCKRGTSRAVYGQFLEWIREGKTILREEGREYLQLAIGPTEEILAAIDAAGGVDIFIHSGDGLVLKRDVAQNPAEDGKIFWTDSGELISVSEWVGDLLGSKNQKKILEDLDEPVLASAYDPATGLAILDGAGNVRIFEIAQKNMLKEKCRIAGQRLSRGEIAFCDKGSGLGVLDEDQMEIRLLDIKSRSVLGKKSIPDIKGKWRLASDPEGLLMGAAVEKQVYLFRDW